MRSPERTPALGIRGRIHAVVASSRITLSAAVAGLMAVISTAGSVMAASPAPSGAVTGDPRSSGQGPGLVGDPAGAIVAVLLVGIVALAVTLLYVRATGGPGRRSVG